jgi:hypothetical protein
MGKCLMSRHPRGRYLMGRQLMGKHLMGRYFMSRHLRAGTSGQASYGLMGRHLCGQVPYE